MIAKVEVKSVSKQGWAIIEQSHLDSGSITVRARAISSCSPSMAMVQTITRSKAGVLLSASTSFEQLELVQQKKRV